DGLRLNGGGPRREERVGLAHALAAEDLRADELREAAMPRLEAAASVVVRLVPKRALVAIL
ncbi:MAG TPA: hypothetical protein PKI49_13315, partial [Pseudomonadota bacterium]|nr:hypothetical protein [Pseudomonadota bacterium]